jgi:hypothetical protein
MKEIQQEARFIGTDGNMNYKRINTYQICVYIKDRYIWVRCSQHPDCPYSSMVALLNNWAFD